MHKKLCIRVLSRMAPQSGAREEIKAYFMVLVHTFNHIKVNPYYKITRVVQCHSNTFQREFCVG